jgi:hypothetical protein
LLLKEYTFIYLPHIEVEKGIYQVNIKLKLFLFSILISVGSLSFGDLYDFEFVILSDGTAEIRGCLETCPTDLVIPETNGYGVNVTSIGIGAFIEQNIESVSFPENLTSIKNGAFQSNKLSSLLIPNNVVEIEANAFRYNELTEFTLLALA